MSDSDDSSPSETAPTLWKWIAASLTFTGLLSALGYTCGYVIESARDELLGVVVRDPDHFRILDSAAAFSFDLWRTLLDLLSVWVTVPRLLGVWLIGSVAFLGWRTAWCQGLVARIGSASSSRAPLLKRAARLLSVTLVVTIVLGKIAYFDLPAAALQDVLHYHLLRTTLPGPQQMSRDFVHGKSLKLWEQVYCAHVTTTGTGCNESSDSKANLRSQFVKDLVATASAILLGVSVIVHSSRREGWVWICLTLPPILMVAMVGLFYFYGKTLRPTIPTPEVTIQYETSHQITGYILGADVQPLRRLALPATVPIARLEDKDWFGVQIKTSQLQSIRYLGGGQIFSAGNHSYLFSETRIPLRAFDITEFRSVRKPDKLRSTKREAPEVVVDFKDRSVSTLHGYSLAETKDAIFLFNKDTLEIIQLPISKVLSVETERLSDVVGFRIGAAR